MAPTLHPFLVGTERGLTVKKVAVLRLAIAMMMVLVLFTGCKFGKKKIAKKRGNPKFVIVACSKDKTKKCKRFKKRQLPLSFIEAEWDERGFKKKTTAKN